MNSTHSRLNRTPPKRSGPIRNPLVREGPPCAPPPGAFPNGVLGGALESGVRTAYAVIDEYMRRGYEFARDNYANGRGDMNKDRPGYGNDFNPWGSMGPLMDQWQTMMRMWANTWTSFMPGAANWQQSWPASGAGGYPTAPAAPAISVEVSSQRPTEVSVYLEECADPSGLTADSFMPPLVDSVTLRSRDGCLGVRVSIRDDQAPGRYNGVIRAADGSIVGKLVVTIAPSPKHGG